MRNVVALVVIAMLWTAAPVRACWDGEQVTVGNVTYVGAHIGWDADRVRELATWLARLDALVGPDAQLEVHWGGVERRDPRRGDAAWDWDGRSFAALFREVAARSSATPEQIRRARSLTPTLLTVQVAALSDRARADALAARLSESGAGDHGVYETGGFPADNPTAHVVTGEDGRGRPVHRVMVGAFLDAGQAERVRGRIADRLGLRGLVRAL